LPDIVHSKSPHVGKRLFSLAIMSGMVLSPATTQGLLGTKSSKTFDEWIFILVYSK